MKQKDKTLWRDLNSLAETDRAQIWRDIENAKPPEILYHYTSAQGLIGILDKNSLWATDIRHLNDPRELYYAEGIAREALYKIEAKYRAQLGPAADAITELQFALRESLKIYEKNFTNFIACFCEDGDLLSQWRGYGANADGFAIGFSPSAFSWQKDATSFIDFRKVIYNEATLKTLIDVALERTFDLFIKSISAQGAEEAQRSIPLISAYFERLVADAAYVFKHDAFKEENEWRIVYAMSNDSVNIDTQYRVLQGRLTPYIPLIAPTSDGKSKALPIRRVVFGPTLDTTLTKRVVTGLLKKYGYKDVEVMPSRIPFRV